MISKWELTAMSFLSISGGPIGMESAMIGSNIWAIQFLAAWCLITYMIPISYMSYEMTIHYDTMRPNGGPMGWVYSSMGKRWGIANGVWDILDTLIDNAIYPVLFADNCLKMGYIPASYHSMVAWIMIGVTGLINYGEVQGIASIVLVLFVMSPFIAGMFVTPWEDMYTQTNNVITLKSLQTSFTIMTWSINGYDMASPYAHKVSEPKEAYKLNYIFNSFGTYIMMVVVFSMGCYYRHDPNSWIDGIFVSMADDAGGNAGRWWMGAAACVASFGVLTAELCSTSYLFVALSRMGFSPRFSNTTFNLILNVIILSACVLVKLDTLIELSAFLNTLTLQCEVISWLKTFEWTHRRVVFSCWLTVNNIIILACLQETCVFALIGSFGLAAACVWLCEKSINDLQE